MTRQLEIEKINDPLATGTVKFYDIGRGLGFIQPDGGGKGAFVHVSALARAGMVDLVEDQQVSFDAEVDQRSGKSFVMRIK